MNTTAEKILEQYGALMDDVSKKASNVYQSASDIPCKNKCFDCCKQLFPVSFAEAFYLSRGFRTLPKDIQTARTNAAKTIRNKILKADPAQFEKQNVDRAAAMRTQSEFARFLHNIESDCPALDPKNPAGACTVYEFRNHDCRVMGASFDVAAKTVVGCFRFKNLKHVIPSLMSFNYRYAEKMDLDRALITALTDGQFTENILYFTTMCGPLLVDYETRDWTDFFTSKFLPLKGESSDYHVVIDV